MRDNIPPITPHYLSGFECMYDSYRSVQIVTRDIEAQSMLKTCLASHVLSACLSCTLHCFVILVYSLATGGGGENIPIFGDFWRFFGG